MRTELSFSSLAQIQTELLAVLAVDIQTAKGPDVKPQPVLLTRDERVMSAAAAVLSSGEYKAGPNETVLLHAPAGLAAKRLVRVGLGNEAKATVLAARPAAPTISGTRNGQAPKMFRAAKVAASTTWMSNVRNWRLRSVRRAAARTTFGGAGATQAAASTTGPIGPRRAGYRNGAARATSSRAARSPPRAISAR